MANHSADLLDFEKEIAALVNDLAEPKPKEEKAPIRPKPVVTYSAAPGKPREQQVNHLEETSAPVIVPTALSSKPHNTAPTPLTAAQARQKAKLTTRPAVMQSIAVVNPYLSSSYGAMRSAPSVGHGQTPYDSDVKGKKKRAVQKVSKNANPVTVRKAAGKLWEDKSLLDWPENDFRLFCGDLGNEVSDDMLSNAFKKYSSFVKARVIRDRKSGKSKGYGFVSFTDPTNFTKAFREMNGRYVGNRPIKLRKSKWKDRTVQKSGSAIK